MGTALPAGPPLLRAKDPAVCKERARLAPFQVGFLFSLGWVWPGKVVIQCPFLVALTQEQAGGTGDRMEAWGTLTPAGDPWSLITLRC